MTTFVVCHGGNMVDGPYGVNYIGGEAHFLVMEDQVVYATLVQAISDKLAIGSNQRISKMWHRSPSWHGQHIVHSKNAVTNDSDVSTMVKLASSVPGDLFIELYVEIAAVAAFTEQGDSSNEGLATTVDSNPVQQLPHETYLNPDDAVYQNSANLVRRYGEGPTVSLYNIAGVDIPDNRESSENFNANLPQPTRDGTCIGHGIGNGATAFVVHIDDDIEVSDEAPGQNSFYTPHSQVRSKRIQCDVIAGSVSTGDGRTGKKLKMDDRFRLGQPFKDKQEVMSAVTLYSKKVNANYAVLESSSSCWDVVCVERSCPWTFRAHLRKGHGDLFVVSRYKGSHTCLSPQLPYGYWPFYSRVTCDRSRVDAKFLCDRIIEDIKKNPATPIHELRVNLYRRLNVKPSYNLIWEAKEEAIAKIFGDWDQSYNKLPVWMNAMKASNPGSIVEWDFVFESQNGQWVGEDKKIFRRVFWAFKPCIDSLRFAKPVLAVDNTSLHGKYEHSLMIAAFIDGDHRIVPIAYALVESGNGDSWRWFMGQLRAHVVQHRNDFFVISNLNIAIESLMTDKCAGWNPKSCHHRFCLRSVCNNFDAVFKNAELKKLLEKAGKTCQWKKFDKFMEMIENINPDAKRWIGDNLSRKEKWAMSCDREQHWGHANQDVPEFVRSLLTGARHMPVTALVRFTSYATVMYYHNQQKHYRARLAQGKVFTSKCESILNYRLKRARLHKVTPSSRFSFQYEIKTGVDEVQRKGGNGHTVNLKDHSCSCGKFQRTRIPCSHALAAMLHDGIDYSTYIHKIYKIDYNLRLFECSFVPPGPEDELPLCEEHEGRKIIPDPASRMTATGKAKLQLSPRPLWPF